LFSQRADGHVSAICVSRDGCINEIYLSVKYTCQRVVCWDNFWLYVLHVDQKDGQWSSGVNECIRDGISRSNYVLCRSQSEEKGNGMLQAYQILIKIMPPPSPKQSLKVLKESTTEKEAGRAILQGAQ
jgi:hypothetical protein